MLSDKIDFRCLFHIFLDLITLINSYKFIYIVHIHTLHICGYMLMLIIISMTICHLLKEWREKSQNFMALKSVRLGVFLHALSPTLYVTTIQLSI